VGAAINYTVYVRKADAEDNFSSVTEIANSGAQSIATDTESDLLFENVTMGDCSNGIEVEIKIEPGAITTKNFEISELQLVNAAAASVLQKAPLLIDMLINSKPRITDYSNALHDHSSSLEGGPLAIIPSGTKMLFYQASAPTGWTQVTTQNDKALRVVSGAGGGSGGSLALSSSVTGGHTLVESEIPSHTHNIYGDSATDFSGGSRLPAVGAAGFEAWISTQATGGDGSHDHPLDLAYVDIIIAAKD
jgi:hypothetical protein